MPAPARHDTKRLGLRVTVSSDETVLAATGELDRSVAGQLGATLHGLMELYPTRLVLDLSALTFMDASGLGIIAGAARTRPAPDERLTVRSAAPTALRMLDVTGLSAHLDFDGNLR